jgi:hypothetical protein
MDNLPAIGQSLELDVDGFVTCLSARVEDHVPPALVRVGLPSDGTTTVNLASGREVSLIWSTDTRSLMAPGVVRGHATDGIQLIEIELLSAPARLQRRDLVRAALALRVSFLEQRDDAGHPVPIGTTLNISGAGMLVRVASHAGIADEAPMQLELAGHPPFHVNARRVRETDDGAVAFAFDGFAGPEQERLIRLVFAEHRREHAVQRHVRAA